MDKLTEKQKRFCDEYLIDLNATQAYRRAGYSVKNDSVASVEGHKLLDNPKVREYLRQRMEGKEAERIARQDEVLECLTSIMRGERLSETVVIEGCGKGHTRAKRMERAPDGKEQLKAAELLGKRYGLFSGLPEGKSTIEDDGFIEALRTSIADVWPDEEEPPEPDGLIEENAEPESEKPAKTITRRIDRPESMSTRQLRAYVESIGVKGCSGLSRKEILEIIKERQL